MTKVSPYHWTGCELWLNYKLGGYKVNDELFHWRRYASLGRNVLKMENSPPQSSHICFVFTQYLSMVDYNLSVGLLQRFIIGGSPIKLNRVLNLLVPDRCGSNFHCMILKHISVTDIGITPRGTSIKWMQQHLNDDVSILIQVMALCRQATRLYLGQGWPRCMSPYNGSRSQWVNIFWIWNQHWLSRKTSNGSWCIGIKGEMSGTVCVTFTWDIYIYIWVAYSFCLFCCLFIIVTWWYIWCIVSQVASKRKYRHVW